MSASWLRDIHEPNAFGGNPPHWDAALSAMPVGALPFLDSPALPLRRLAAGLAAERDPLLREMAVDVAADPALRCLAWYLYWRVFVAPEHGVPWGAPSLTARLGGRAGLFYLLLALEFPPRLAAWHRRLGYPQAVTAQTIHQLASFEQNHLRGRGAPGIHERQFPWLAMYLANPYVRLGRFEYMLGKHSGVSAWKHTADGRVLALARDGCRVAEDGLCLPGDAAEHEGWTASLEETPEAVIGFPVDPRGRILRRRTRLERDAWACCLSNGMPVLDLHIPAGGGMSWDAVTDSFTQALDFFARYHLDQPFAALVTTTWFMDPRLADILPADANPVRLQRAAYLFPVPPSPGGLWFVFLRDTTGDPATLPRDTSLRRHVADFLASGGTWNGGGMFILREHLRHPHDGLYRTLATVVKEQHGIPLDGQS